MGKLSNHHKIVLPGHLNDHGNLFGGYLLKWIDEIAYISVSLDFPGQKFVTIALNNVEFKHQIREGQILRFACEQTRVGNTSVTYDVHVYGERYKMETGSAENSDEKDIGLFETQITFVCIDEKGEKQAIKK